MAFVGTAQTQITGFYGYLNNDPGTADGTATRSYQIVSPEFPLDQTASGPNMVWNFTTLYIDGTSTYQNAAPTGSESSTYPGTNRVVTNTRTINANATVSKAFFNTLAITGVSNADFQVNFTDNGVLTNTTLDYGNTYSDPIAGTFTYDIYSGTFTGNMVTTVDAYGTLTTDDLPWGLDVSSVTRMKVVQTLTLSSAPFGVVGAAVFTNYYYYRAGDLFPYFNSSISDLSIPLLGIDEEIMTYEAATPTFLGVSSNVQNIVSIAPNPVRDILTIQADDVVSFNEISVLDINGRTVIKADPSDRQINLTSLSSGIYFVRAVSDGSIATKKIVKQ